MNINAITNSITKFGTHFIVYHSDTNLEWCQRLCDSIEESGNHVLLREYDKPGDPVEEFDYDVILLCDIRLNYTQNEYPKTVLCIGNTACVREFDSSDLWTWNTDTLSFVQAPHNGRYISPLNASDPNCASSWEEALKTSFTRLWPYRKEGQLFPVYAGPQPLHSIDYLAIVDVVNHIKENLVNGYTRIVFDDKDEAIFWTRIYRIHSIIKRLKHIFSPGSFLFITSALNGQEIYAEWCAKNNVPQELVVVPAARFESVAKSCTLDQGALFSYRELDTPVNTNKRSKKYLCYNRMPRLHRIKVITELHKAGLIEQGYVSFHNEEGMLNRDGRWESMPYENTHWNETFEYFYNNILPELDYTLNKTKERWNPVDIKKDDLEHFSDSYFSIVNETLFYKTNYQYKHMLDISPTNSVFLSEKIYKPLVCKHPFVLIAVDTALENLKKFGYKTFDGWIDESYDQEPDDDKRMEMCLAEIKRLCALSDDEWQQMIIEMTPTLQHNFDTFCRNKDLIIGNFNFLEIFRNNEPY